MGFLTGLQEEHASIQTRERRAVDAAEGMEFASDAEREEWIRNKADQLHQRAGISSVEDLVDYSTPKAQAIIEASSRGAADLAGLGGEEATRELAPYLGGENIDALQWQRSLLGLLGPEAQQFGISGIKDTPFQKEVDLRQQRKLLRQAAMGGDLGGGATIQGMTQLAGAQAGERILRKVEELQPLVDIAQTTRSGVSGIAEDVGARQMEYLSSIGPQLANIRLGQAAPIVEARMQQANLSGLQGIGEADEQGQILGQLANLAGSTNFFGIGTGGSGPQPLQIPAPGSIWT